MDHLYELVNKFPLVDSAASTAVDPEAIALEAVLDLPAAKFEKDPYVKMIRSLVDFAEFEEVLVGRSDEVLLWKTRRLIFL